MNALDCLKEESNVRSICVYENGNVNVNGNEENKNFIYNII